MLKASVDNKAETVRRHFLEALQTWPLPSRLRTDRGGENVLVGRMLVDRQGADRGSWIQGPSVHNQRIERLWRDVRISCSQTYIDMFHSFEEEDILDSGSPLDRFALQYIYTPRLNRALAEFQDAWNNHGLRTECSRTPLQLWAAGLLQLYGSRHVVEVRDEPDETVNDWNQYGVDFENGLLEMDDDDRESSQVQALSQLRLPADVTRTMTRLVSHIDPMQESTDHGKELYLNVRELVHRSQE